VKKRALWLAAAMTAAVPFAAAHADGHMGAHDEGWYLGVGVGANWLQDSEVGGLNSTIDTDLGALGVIRFGYHYGNGWLTEVEVGYRRNNVDQINGVDASDKVNNLDGMINVLYQFETGTMFRPYLGVGLGASSVRLDNITPIAGTRIDDSDVVFAYQGIAGAMIDIDQALGVFLEYRYLGTDEPDFNTDSGISVEAENQNHSALIGLRYKWAKPKPAPEPEPVIERAAEEPPPAPEPEPEPIPRNFIIFFDWDQDVITQEAMGILSEAANYAKQAGVARIVLTGHADRSGSASYNEGLSLRRANNAMAELVNLGIAQDAIAVFAKGEAEPLVPTDDGVREPQNRRVEIVLE